MKTTTIQLTREEEDRIEALDRLLGGETIFNIRESEERKLAIREAEAIFSRALARP